MTEMRKHFAAEQKMTILRRHLLERLPVSDLCDEYGIHPTVFYRWQKQLFEEGVTVFESHSKKEADSSARRIAALEDKLMRKNEVLSELMEELVQLKKEFGGV